MMRLSDPDIQLDILFIMDAASEIRLARRRFGLTQRELAQAVGTSQATLSAYESGRKQPSVETLQRLLHACGSSLRVGRPQLDRAGRHLAEVLALAEALPFKPATELRYPRLPSP
jgi:transcriptional regulator with XRE-family HTH domain